jgi:hypothetical protein
MLDVAERLERRVFLAMIPGRKVVRVLQEQWILVIPNEHLNKCLDRKRQPEKKLTVAVVFSSSSMTFRIFGLLSIVFSDTDFTGTVTGAVPSGATAIDGAILLQVF